MLAKLVTTDCKNPQNEKLISVTTKNRNGHMLPTGQGLGKVPATKSDEFLEKCQRGWGSFSIQKLILQILGTLNRAF